MTCRRAQMACPFCDTVLVWCETHTQPGHVDQAETEHLLGHVQEMTGEAMSTPEEHNRIEDNLSYHPVTEATKPLFEANREDVKKVAHAFADRLPPGRHAALAQTALQEALMWANAAVAIDS